MTDKKNKIKGHITFETDEKGLEGRLTYTPDPDGEEWNEEKASRLIMESGVPEKVEAEKLKEAFRQFSAAEGESVSCVVVTGTPPETSINESVEWPEWEVPAELRNTADECLATAGDPVVFDIQITEIEVEQKIEKKAPLSFMKSKEEIVKKWKKQESRIPVKVTNTVLAMGYFNEGEVIGVIEFVEAGRSGKVTLCLGEGIRRIGNEIRLEKAGFVRRGDNWVDLLPYKRHQYKVYASRDNVICFLDFTPGSGDLPGAEDIIAQAGKHGFSAEELLSPDEVGNLLKDAVAASRSISKEILNRSMDDKFDITISPDRLKTTLTIRKASDRGKKLSLKELGQAISQQKLKGMDLSRVKKDILAFMKGPEKDMEDYVLVEGTPPAQGKDGEIKVTVIFLSGEEASGLLEKIRLQGSSRDATEKEAVRLAFVKKDVKVAEIIPPGQGKPGVDVQGKTIPGLSGNILDLKLEANLVLKDNEVFAQMDGLLRWERQPGAILAGINLHRDGRVTVRITEDKMQGFIALKAPCGIGEKISANQVSDALVDKGIVKGINSSLLIELTQRFQGNEDVPETLIAEGVPLRQGSGSRLRFHVPITSGRALYVVPQAQTNGNKGREKNSTTKDSLLAEILPPMALSRDGWDITGNVLPSSPAPGIDIEIGKNVRRETTKDGIVRFVAEKSGEVFYDGNLLDIKGNLLIKENVTPGRGEIRFSGSVRIDGSVEKGCRIFVGGDIMVNGSVIGSVLSSGGAIEIKKGVLGVNNAIIRAKGDIKADFMSDAVVLAIGDIRVTKSCLRCKVRCNQKLIIESDDGKLVGGNIKSKHGIETANLGSEKGIRTEISFGQDYLVADQIEIEEREINKLKTVINSLDIQMRKLEEDENADHLVLEETWRKKLENLRILKKRSMCLLNLREKFEEHFPSEVKIGESLFPGVVLESHGRIYETKDRKNNLAICFDSKTAKIQERNF